MAWEHYAAVPGGDRASLVVVDGRLPSVTIDSYRLPDALAALAPAVGEPVYLRPSAHVEREPDHYLRLHEFDAGGRGELLPLDRADPTKLAPPELRPSLERWLDEQRGAPVPTERPPWACPGWHAEAEAWVGCKLRPHRLWPLSAVLCGERDGKRIWLKAVFPLFHHEPAVTAALAREHGGALPEVLGIDEARGWLLMGELDAAEARSAAVLRTVRELHDEWSGRHDELLALGAPRRTLDVLGSSVAELVRDVALEHADAIPALEAACRDLAAHGIAETIVHGDLHPGNAVVGEHGQAVIFDWSDTCIAHPLFDVHLFLFCFADEARREERREAYGVGADALRAAAAPSWLHQAVSYRGINAGLEPGDRWWFAGEERRWIERAVELVM
jgi:hypothetical protein